MTTFSKKLVDLYNFKFKANQTLLAAMLPLPVQTRVHRLARMCISLHTGPIRHCQPDSRFMLSGDGVGSRALGSPALYCLSFWVGELASWAEGAPSPPSVPAYPNDTHSLRNSFLTPLMGEWLSFLRCPLSDWPSSTLDIPGTRSQGWLAWVI